VVQKVTGNHQQKDHVGNHIRDDIGEKRKTRRGQLIDQRINVCKISIAHGVIVDFQNHLDNVKLQPLRELGHHAVLKPSIAEGNGHVEDQDQHKITEKHQGRLRLFLLHVLNDIGRDEGNAVCSQHVNRDTR
jgi:hypothetical protein